MDRVIQHLCWWEVEVDNEYISPKIEFFESKFDYNINQEFFLLVQFFDVYSYPTFVLAGGRDGQWTYILH